MIYIKTKEEIRIIKEGGKRLAIILRRLVKELKPGVSTAHIEEIFEQSVREIGGLPAFKNYPMGDGIFFHRVFVFQLIMKWYMALPCQKELLRREILLI